MDVTVSAATADRLPVVGARGVPAIGEPGRAACELPAGEPPAVSSVADHVLSEFLVGDLEIRAASVRGLMHRYRGEPRQDTFSVVYDRPSDTIVVVVCDGVGSLPRSHEAAAFVTDRLPSLYWTHRDWTAAMNAVNTELQDVVDGIRAGLDPADQNANRMATTVVAAAVSSSTNGRCVDIVRSDDSTAWTLSPKGFWSEVADLEKLDGAVHTGSVRALPAAVPRLRHAHISFDEGALFIMTDGVDGPLRGAAEVRDALGEWWATPPTIFDFGRQVGFARKTHLDDRTAVGVWIKDANGG